MRVGILRDAIGESDVDVKVDVEMEVEVEVVLLWFGVARKMIS